MSLVVQALVVQAFEGPDGSPGRAVWRALAPGQIVRNL